tara:strand:- start:164 stop:439 length:276 start_codon:yes stop_codon:yes gene_type:complete
MGFEDLLYIFEDKLTFKVFSEIADVRHINDTKIASNLDISMDDVVKYADGLKKHGLIDEKYMGPTPRIPHFTIYYMTAKGLGMERTINRLG